MVVGHGLEHEHALAHVVNGVRFVLFFTQRVYEELGLHDEPDALARDFVRVALESECQKSYCSKVRLPDW